MENILVLGSLMMALIGPSHAETVSPRRLLEVVDLADPVMSPDGRYVAFRSEQASVERNTYDTVWYVQGADGKSPPRRVSDGGVPLRDSAGLSLPAPAVWSPDGRWIYYRALIDGRAAVWRAAVEGSGAEAVTSDPADVRDFSLSADGKTLRYSVGATREEVVEAELAEYDRGIRVDDTVPIAVGLFRSSRFMGRPATQRYVGWVTAPLLANVPEHWKAVDLATGEARGLAPSEVPPRLPTVSELAEQGLPEPWMMAIDHDTGRVALLTRVGEGAGLLEKPDVELALLPKAGSSQTIKCQAESCTGKAISGIQWRPRSDEVLFTVSDPHEGRAQSIYRWNVRTGAVHLVTQSAGLLGGGRDRHSACGVSPEALACVAADADRPPRLERVDLTTGGRRVLFDPNAALALDMAKTAPSRLLRWTDAKGQEFTGQFFPAQRTGRGLPPLFVNYYDCSGFLRGGVGDEWPLASMAESGISALCINRVSSWRLDAVERYGQGLSAVESVIGLLASNGEIDRTKVGMGGHSFGSEVTFWTAMKSNLIVAGSVTSPVMAPNYYLFFGLKNEAFFQNMKRNWQLGAPSETPGSWEAISPVFHLDDIRAPILMQTPEQEYLFSLEYAIPLMRGHRVDLYVFPDEPHQKFQPRHKLAAYERNLDWFRFWLQGHEEPLPSKKTQYARWREMKDAVSARSTRSSARWNDRL